jgi:IS30 family transposase
MKKHHKITASERDQIAWWLASGVPIREMARRLSRSPSSISEELKRNQVDGIYGSIKAHQAAEARKRNSHQKYLLRRRPGLRDFVLEKLKLGWSPSRFPEDSRRKSTREYARKGNTSITSPSTNFSMTQRRKTRSSGLTCLEVIGNEDAGWVEEVDQSKSPPGFDPIPTSRDW